MSDVFRFGRGRSQCFVIVIGVIVLRSEIFDSVARKI